MGTFSFYIFTSDNVIELCLSAMLALARTFSSPYTILRALLDSLCWSPTNLETTLKKPALAKRRLKALMG